MEWIGCFTSNLPKKSWRYSLSTLYKSCAFFRVAEKSIFSTHPLFILRSQKQNKALIRPNSAVLAGKSL